MAWIVFIRLRIGNIVVSRGNYLGAELLLNYQAGLSSMELVS